MVNEPFRQLVQNPRGGGVRLVEVPTPRVAGGQFLVAVRSSLISAGTERMVTAFAEKSLLGKARARPGSRSTLAWMIHCRLDIPRLGRFWRLGRVLKAGSGRETASLSAGLAMLTMLSATWCRGTWR